MNSLGQSGVDKPEGSSSLSRMRTETSESRRIQKAELKLGAKIIPFFTFWYTGLLLPIRGTYDGKEEKQLEPEQK